MHPQSAREGCPNKQGLIADIQLAISEVINLNNVEMAAVIKGEFEKVKSIQEQLVDARQWKESVIEAYHAHIREHGC